jgi:peptide/nickel transport system substrate-binding protein
VQTGAVDIAEWLLPNELVQLSVTPDVKVSNWRANFHVIYALNTLRPPFDNPLVREAVKWAFPYQEVHEAVFFDLAESMKSLVPSVYPDNTEEHYPFTTDLEKAKQLLVDAGFPDGFQSELTYNSEIPWDEQMAIMVQTNLSQIGIELTLGKLPGGAFFDKEWGRELTTYFFEDQPNVPAAEYAMWLFGNSESRGDHTSWVNEEYDRLTLGALAELDPAKRQAMNVRAQEIIAMEGPYVFVGRPPHSLAMRSTIEGARWFPGAHIRWDELEKT